MVAVRLDRLWEYSTPARPARAAETVNAISLYLVILIPTDSAAIRLSRMAIMARPSLESTRFVTINKVIRRRMTPIRKVEVRWRPCDPLRSVDDHISFQIHVKGHGILHGEMESVGVLSDPENIHQVLDDLAKCQGYNGQVVTFQPQGRNPDQDPEYCRCGGSDQKRQEKPTEALP